MTIFLQLGFCIAIGQCCLCVLYFGSYDSAHLMEIVTLNPFGFLRVLHGWTCAYWMCVCGYACVCAGYVCPHVFVYFPVCFLPHNPVHAIKPSCLMAKSATEYRMEIIPSLRSILPSILPSFHPLLGAQPGDIIRIRYPLSSVDLGNEKYKKSCLLGTAASAL